ncbi:putative methyltransferase-domain-containing protein [Schizophyllum amplum]|uniref:Putative methyltransferase-domain-containing protein n=1 Tax=Schizophyllum amplum TaxID=97359 RepID=A0A550CKN4_9AGAR|nr:putative methyltransferase-domain-containing protein [Auriculariopsis ampla]
MIGIGPIRLTDDSERVFDADEEIFLLYAALQAHPLPSNIHRGLGFLDSQHDKLSVTIELKDPSLRPAPTSTSYGGKRSSRNSRKIHLKRESEPDAVQVELHQDKTRLHTAKGDTGSVLWRASIDFATLVLQQHHAHNPASLFECELLPSLTVLELGAGTGLLPLLLAPLVDHYTATDIPALTPLISKNVQLNSPNRKLCNVTVEALDWEELHRTSASRRQLFTYNDGRIATEDSAVPDVILAVDCIYNPSLVGPLVSTINHFAAPDKTVVVVVSELRSEEVMRDFLEAWLRANTVPSSDQDPQEQTNAISTRWEIWRAGDGADGSGLLGVPYVTWIGRRVLTSSSSSES